MKNDNADEEKKNKSYDKLCYQLDENNVVQYAHVVCLLMLTMLQTISLIEMEIDAVDG